MEDRVKVVVKSIITAPVEKVWKLWTDPSHIKNWNIASDEYYCPDAKNDLRESGKFCYTMAAKDNSMHMEFNGTYIEIIPEKLIKYELEDSRLVTIVFSSIGNETEIIETFEAESTNSVEMQQSGWNAILNNFKKYCEDPNTSN